MLVVTSEFVFLAKQGGIVNIKSNDKVQYRDDTVWETSSVFIVSTVFLINKYYIYTLRNHRLKPLFLECTRHLFNHYYE